MLNNTTKQQKTVTRIVDVGAVSLEQDSNNISRKIEYRQLTIQQAYQEDSLQHNFLAQLIVRLFEGIQQRP